MTKVIVNVDDKSKSDLISKYNHELKWLMKKIYAISNNAMSISSLRNQLALGISADPEVGLIYSGPELYGFKDAIRKRDVNYFCMVDYKDTPQAGPIKYDQSVLLLLQEQMPKCTDYEKDQLFKRINDMLNMYLEYTLFVKCEKLKDDEIKEYGYKRISASDYKKISDARTLAKREKKKKKKEESKNASLTNSKKIPKGDMRFPISDSEDSEF